MENETSQPVNTGTEPVAQAKIEVSNEQPKKQFPMWVVWAIVGILIIGVIVYTDLSINASQDTANLPDGQAAVTSEDTGKEMAQNMQEVYSELNDLERLA